MAMNMAQIRRQFPALQTQVSGHPLVYLDNAATAQKPEAVLRAMDAHERAGAGNAHRGMHVLAELATMTLERARGVIQKFLNAVHPEEIIFTKSTTESINLVARSLGKNFERGDLVVLTELEHHSNIVPWLQLKEERGIDVLWVPCDEHGTLDLVALDRFLAVGNVKLVSVTAQSNVLGCRPAIGSVTMKAHAAGALVLIDAAQSVAHGPTDVQALDADFLAFSGHKLYGPEGIGILYGKKKLLEAMPPFLGGGMMIAEVHKDGFTPADLPQKFEAGTQPISEAEGLRAAIEWLRNYSWGDIAAHEARLLGIAEKELSKIPGLRIFGAAPYAGCLSFVTEGAHPHDLTEILGREGICMRAGHHCTQPLHERLGVNATTRLSVALYNTEEEILAVRPAMEAALKKLRG